MKIESRISSMISLGAISVLVVTDVEGIDADVLGFESLFLEAWWR